jgi:hypothetical protein
VQLILSPDDDREDNFGVDDFDCDSHSRYAEPEAEGVTPVLRTAKC